MAIACVWSVHSTEADHWLGRREFKFIEPGDEAAKDSFYELPAGFTLSKLKGVMTMSDTDLV